MSTIQQYVMEADYDTFKIIPRYINALPRSTYDESHALDLKLIQRGQQIPIIVNRKMWILDGYTRHDLLGQRGKKIKYVFMDFLSEDEEYEYVVETNVMRRQLNMFQRVEAMYQFFMDETLARREKDRTSQFDVMQAMNLGAKSTTDIEKNTKYKKRTVLRILNELKDIWCVGQGDNIYKKHKKGNGGTIMFTWRLLPKGKEMLSKREPRKIGSVSNMIGKIIGAGRSSVQFATYIIENGDASMIQQCRNGTLSIRMAHGMLSDNRGRKVDTRFQRWLSNTKIKCPHCNNIEPKSKYTKVE